MGRAVKFEALIRYQKPHCCNSLETSDPHDPTEILSTVFVTHKANLFFFFVLFPCSQVIISINKYVTHDYIHHQQQQYSRE